MRRILKSRPDRESTDLGRESALRCPQGGSQLLQRVVKALSIRRRVPERTMGFGQMSLSQTQLFTDLAMLTTCLDEAADLLQHVGLGRRFLPSRLRDPFDARRDLLR